MALNTLFFGLNEKDVKYLTTYFKGQKTIIKKDSIIMTNIRNTNLIGMIITGEAVIVRYEYNGNRTIIKHLSDNNVFGKFFTSDNNNDLTIIALEDTEILTFNYEDVLQNYRGSNIIQNQFLINILQNLSNNLTDLNDHIAVLTKRTTREKLLDYFNTLALKSLSKSINLPFTYTVLADYLGVDRCAMMREIKYLKDDGLIVTYGKKIIIKY